MSSEPATFAASFCAWSARRPFTRGRLVAIAGDRPGSVVDFWGKWFRLPLRDTGDPLDHGPPYPRVFPAYVLPEPAGRHSSGEHDVGLLARLVRIVDTKRVLVAVPMQRPELAMAFIDEIVIAYRGRLLKRLHPEDYPLACA